MGAVAVRVGLVGFFYLSGVGFRWKVEKICHDAVLKAGAALRRAAMTVHAVTAATAPDGPSPYDIHEDDEEFVEGLDGEAWDVGGYHVDQVDATITPADPAAVWDPTALAVVPADFEPADPTDVCDQLGGLHSAAEFAGDRWRRFADRGGCGCCSPPRLGCGR